LLLNSTTGTGLFAGLVADFSGGGWALDNAGGGSLVLTPTTFAPFGLHLLVVKCEFFAGNDRFTLYVDPPAGQPEPGAGTVVKFNSDVGSITNIGVTVLKGSFDEVDFDEIRIGAAWEDVAPSCPTISVTPAPLATVHVGQFYA